MKICGHCKKEYTPGRNTMGKYCSNQCQQDHSFHQRYEAWLNGHVESSPTWLKRALLKLHGHSCSICKLAVWNDQPIPLETEHKDGNSENNSISNLCLICPNCHAQTPTYKARNRGNGRHFRRVRYAAGQSY